MSDILGKNISDDFVIDKNPEKDFLELDVYRTCSCNCKKVKPIWESFRCVV